MNSIFNLDYQNRQPIFKQIIEQIKKYVALGILKPKDKLPSTREMASELGVNPNTIRKAYSILENEGVIVTISTKGTFIADDPSKIKDTMINNTINEINEKIKELTKLGITKEEIIKKLK